jgi:hypothetical protein
MKRIVFLLLLTLMACGPRSEKMEAKPAPSTEPAPRVDNAAVRYSDALLDSVQKAKAAQGKANQAIAAEQSAAQTAQQAAE